MEGEKRWHKYCPFWPWTRKHVSEEEKQVKWCLKINRAASWEQGGCRLVYSIEKKKGSPENRGSAWGMGHIALLQMMSVNSALNMKLETGKGHIQVIKANWGQARRSTPNKQLWPNCHKIAFTFSICQNQCIKTYPLEIFYKVAWFHLRIYRNPVKYLKNPQLKIPIKNPQV